MNQDFLILMQDTSTVKQLGQRIKQLRKGKSWTQKELAKQINISPAQLNKYESGFNAPPLDRLVLLADSLETTLDFLVTGGDQEQESPIYNTRLVQRLKIIETFESDERETVIKLLDAMIAKHNMESTVKSMSDNASPAQ